MKLYSFEDFLKEKHAEINPDPYTPTYRSYHLWLRDITIRAWLSYGEEYGDLCALKESKSV